MPPHDLSESSELPPDFLNRLRRIVSASAYDHVVSFFTRPSAVGFRVNTLRAGIAEVVESLGAEGLAPRPVPWWEAAFWVTHDDRDRLLSSSAYTDEKIYVQNLSSMIPPLVLDPQPGERVLDLTAAPGSKTLEIACLMRDDGEIAAVEAVRPRFYKLQDNLRRQGARNVRTFLQNGERVWRYRPEHFEKVLLDAPCSSEARFRTEDPDSFRYWSTRKVKEMNRKQRRLLYSAVQTLAPGGRLVYSTCAFSPEENEGAITHLLKQFDGALKIEPIDLDLPNRAEPLTEWEGRSFHPDVSRCLRILPNELMQAFFVCSIRKTASTLARETRNQSRIGQ